MEQLKDYLNCSTLFFFEGEILLNITANNPFQSFLSTHKLLEIEIISAHVDDSILIIEGKSNLSGEECLLKGYKTMPVKPFLAEVDSATQTKILRAYHWVNWHKQSKYCGQCASPLEDQINLSEKKCLSCKVSVFPRFSPAVMVLIQHGNKILLARSPHFKAGFYSAIAGFIEMGETAEEAAHREVKEELGLEITDLEYFGSQTWPFPDSFMIAFKAKYLRGELKIDEKEIEDAQWFDAQNLPELPTTASISRQLIEHAIKDCLEGN